MMNFYKTLQIWSLLWTLVLNELDRYIPLLIWTFHSMNRTYKEDFYRGASLYFGLIKPSATIKNTPVSFFVSLLVCMNMWEREVNISPVLRPVNILHVQQFPDEDLHNSRTSNRPRANIEIPVISVILYTCILIKWLVRNKVG